MATLNITPEYELQPVYSGDGPSVLDAESIRSLLDHADAVLEAANTISDPSTAEAFRHLARGLNDAGALLAAVAAGIYRGNIAVTNYPEAL